MKPDSDDIEQPQEEVASGSENDEFIIKIDDALEKIISKLPERHQKTVVTEKWAKHFAENRDICAPHDVHQSLCFGAKTCIIGPRYGLVLGLFSELFFRKSYFSAPRFGWFCSIVVAFVGAH